MQQVNTQRSSGGGRKEKLAAHNSYLLQGKLGT
jgi:hypothetical protein